MNIKFNVLLMILIVISLTSACKKEKVKPIDELPEATQEGKNTFGCLVNGEAFLPKGGRFARPSPQCSYPFLDNRSGRGYCFSLIASNKAEPNILKIVRLETYFKELEESKTYSLTVPGVKEEASGEYSVSTPRSLGEHYWVQPPVTGELRITKLDKVKRILAGTFWFDALNDEGEKVEVREGRFDMKY